MAKMRRSRSFKKERENNVIDIDEAREKRREKRRLEKEKREEKQSRPEKAAVSQRRRVRERRRRMIYLVILAVIVGIVVYMVWNLWSLKQLERQAQEELLAKQEEKERLQLELENVESDAAIEQEAREQLHMIRPGETVYILPVDPSDENKASSGTDENSAKPEEDE